jgi:large subunit ribosomal protein L33
LSKTRVARQPAVAGLLLDWQSRRVLSLQKKNLSLYLLSTMAKKGNRIQVILECTEHKTSGVAGTSRYITTKNRKNTTERLELRKYNPILKRYTIHREIK